MFIELIELLRCVRPHEDSWLVGSFDDVRARDVRSGTHGCPICGARYAISDGVLRMSTDAGVPLPRRDRIRRPGSDALGTREESIRLAAMLGLNEPGGLALLAGAWGASAPVLRRLVDIHLLLLVQSDELLPTYDESVIVSPDVIPLAAASCRGVALDDTTARESFLESAVHVLRPGGRLVAPAATPVPEGVLEVARDARHWVGERALATSGLVPLQRSSR